MYRFNGYDSRLERELEAMLMVMEALESYEQKIKVRGHSPLRNSLSFCLLSCDLYMTSFQYDIYGHSGEGYKFDMVKSSKPPKNNKERLDVLKVSYQPIIYALKCEHHI